MTTEEEESIERAAAARNERLKHLRAAQQLLSTPDDVDVVDHSHFTREVEEDSIPRRDISPPNGSKEDAAKTDEEEKKLNLKFRNYVPHDKDLQEGKLPPPVLPQFEDPVDVAPPLSEEPQDPFLNIAPKKPNWDLRRDIQKKLDKLERRTQRAIFQLKEQEMQNQALTEEDNDEAVAED
ncbi:hypothetical protein QJS04_geneDACA019227 [Acorus gramineus]|uniref:Coiled-coil domain-containing protein 12 n=1 Tax=Acorus gramineus TaxID=55184 RepID=A0AAV8ZX47_ACOGR|nr:hypothetical protein QJS04_geneDACA019227 [Acorus gramineus]